MNKYDLQVLQRYQWTYVCEEQERGHMNSVLCMRVGGWVEMKRERGSGRRRERKGEIVLSYDERLDWLESDDCSKWPGRWLHLCFPFSLSLIPSSLTHLLSHLHLSLPLRASLCHPLSLVSSWQPINRVPLSPLMAPLLALMHFKRTAAATSQSDGKYMSSSNLHNLRPFFRPISCLCSNALHFVSTLLRLSDSGHHL